MATWTFASLLALRCPSCGRDTFKAGLFRTAKACAACGQVFEAEPGFYAGAIYPFYGGAALLGGGAILFCTLLLDWSFQAGMLVGGCLVLAASPWLFWYSRLAFVHTNHRFFKDGA